MCTFPDLFWYVYCSQRLGSVGLKLNILALLLSVITLLGNQGTQANLIVSKWDTPFLLFFSFSHHLVCVYHFIKVCLQSVAGALKFHLSVNLNNFWRLHRSYHIILIMIWFWQTEVSQTLISRVSQINPPIVRQSTSDDNTEETGDDNSESTTDTTTEDKTEDVEETLSVEE